VAINKNYVRTLRVLHEGDVEPVTSKARYSEKRHGRSISAAPGVDAPRFKQNDPQMSQPPDPRAATLFRDLVELIARLRAPGGCPWDQEQTHASLAIHLLEETYETLDAIDRGDMPHLEEELGDLLLQVVFHAQLARDARAFEIGSVVDGLVDKLVSRHPHVFGEVVVGGAHDVVVNWEVLKRREKQRSSPVEGIPKNLPALLLVHKLQRRAAGAGAPPPDPSPERIAELARSVADRRGDEAGPAVGELLYEVVALAQRAGVDPEGALRKRAGELYDALDRAE
jgi:MazG family protein